MKNFFLSIFGLSAILFTETVNAQPPVLMPANNIVISEKSVTLMNNPESQSYGFSLEFLNTENISCDDISIVSTEAYGFIPPNTVFLPSPNYTDMPQYACEKVKGNIRLSAAPPLTEGFHPWVEKFNIFIGETIIEVTVKTSDSAIQFLTRGSQESMNLEPSFSGCGLRGTILQRVFDCSKKIKNYSVYIDAASSKSNSRTTNTDGTSEYYTLFKDPALDNADLFWFVVSCPAGNEKKGTFTPQQSCAWLTPIIRKNNPALDASIVRFPTFQLSLLNGYQKRLLFSGKMTNDGIGYDFSNVNGLNAQYSKPNSHTAQLYDPTKNPGRGADKIQPAPSSTTVCEAAIGESLDNEYNHLSVFLDADAKIRDQISQTTGAAVHWKVPSYPMYNILTGGTPSSIGGSAICPATGGTVGGPYCDIPSGSYPPPYSNQGFSAINVPGFAMTDETSNLEMLWSSSGTGYSLQNLAWFFFTLSGPVTNNGGTLNFDNPNSLFAVRCMSLTWF